MQDYLSTKAASEELGISKSSFKKLAKINGAEPITPLKKKQYYRARDVQRIKANAFTIYGDINKPLADENE